MTDIPHLQPPAQQGPPTQALTRNKLIRRMAAPDYAAVQNHLSLVSLKSRERLSTPGYDAPYLFFVEDGQVSSLVKIHGSEPIEVGMIGFEGMTPIEWSARPVLENICQIAGSAYRIDRAFFVKAMLDSPGLSRLMFQYQSATHLQLAYTAFSHGRFSVNERLARWLLMLHDRVQGDDIQLSQQFFAWMLGVRRAGVSTAFKELSLSGCVATSRAHVHIQDRAKLTLFAAGSYGPAEQYYERLMGPDALSGEDGS